MPTTIPVSALVDPATGNSTTVASLASVVKSIRFALAQATASSTELIPANARIIRTDLDVTTGYSGGTSPDIVIGYTGSTSAFMASNDHGGAAGLVAAQFYAKQQSTAADSTARAVLATISGTPTGGVAAVEVFYCMPAA